MPIINPTLPADGDDAVVSPYNAAITAILGVINGNVDADNIAAGAIGLSELSATIQAFLVPTASILPFGGSSVPTGWLICDGSSYLRASYSALFAAVGTAYGTVDGTHFNVPDFRGRVPVGASAMGGVSGGRIDHASTLTTVSASPTATVASATGLSVGMYITNANVTAGTTITVINGTTLTMSANATGNGTTVAARFSFIQDSQVLGSAGGTDVHTIITAQLASHTHGGYIIGTGGGNYGSGGFQANQGGGVASLPTGGDQPHPNMQPSLITNYIIKI